MESKENKCCMKVETGTMIFAVINATIWCITTAGTLFGLIGSNIQKALGDSDLNDMWTIVLNIFLGIGLLISSVNFIFGVFLCNGVNKKIPAHIMAYYVFGIIKAVLLSAGNIYIMVGSELYSEGLIGFLFIFLYCLVLWMVKATHAKFTSGDYPSSKHKRLIETIY